LNSNLSADNVKDLHCSSLNIQIKRTIYLNKRAQLVVQKPPDPSYVSQTPSLIPHDPEITRLTSVCQVLHTKSINKKFNLLTNSSDIQMTLRGTGITKRLDFLFYLQGSDANHPNGGFEFLKTFV